VLIRTALLNVANGRSVYFIPGLNGDRFESFTSTRDDGTTCFWPKELLPERLHAAGIKMRIFCYGYNANTHTGRISLQSLWDHGEEFLKTVAEERHIEGVGCNDQDVLIIGWEAKLDLEARKTHHIHGIFSWWFGG
jgi:hypothetical protein